MIFGLFKKTDPICGMKEEKGKGLKKYDKWFCSQNCLESYEKNLKNQPKSNCCH